MRRSWRAVILCPLLAALLGTVACSTAPQRKPATEVGESGATGDAGRAGAAPGGSGGATVQGGTADVGGGSALAPPSDGVAGGPKDVETPHAAWPCDNPQPNPEGGGYLVCEDKSLRLGEPAACPTTLPRAAPADPLFYQECALDSDCTTTAHGFCDVGQCNYGCVSDDECAADQLCFCGVDVGQCLHAGCRSDADCPADYPCTGNLPFGFTGASFECQSPLDSCESDYDCPGARMHCVSAGQRRSCQRDQVG